MSEYSHTILVVDDEEMIRNSFEDLFAKRGYKVLKAADGLDGLEMINNNIIDLAIVDVKMPRMDGITLLSKINGNFPDLPVIIMTGYGSEDIVVDALRNGASNYLKKPFNLFRIIETIEKVLFYKVTKDRLRKRDLLIKKTLQNLDNLKLTFPIEIESIEGGIIFLSEYLFAASDVKTNIEVGVHEALLNAYYHGALNVKKHLSADAESNYYRIATERLRDISVSEKKISLEVIASDDKYVFIITDDGNGFNWAEESQKVEADLEQKPFGRGITLIKAFFDDVTWNEKGNEITMTLKKENK